MANYKAGGDVRTSRIGTKNDGRSFDYISLEKYIAAEESGEIKVAEKVHALRSKLSKESAKSQLEEEKRACAELASLENTLNENNIKMSNAQRKKFLQDFEKERSKKEQEELLKYWQQYSKNAKKEQDKKDKALKKELEVAKLRSTVKEDGTEKTKGEMFKDTAKADTKQNFDMLGKSFKDTISGLGKQLGKGIADLNNAVNNAITTYSNYSEKINARLQGYTSFGDIENILQKVSYSPLIRTETLYENLSDLVAEGIASNIEQRAFLQTVKEGVATTFDANNSALKRIIRLQQTDSTAARLGMEAYLTSYLNALTSNTEYLQSTFDSVADSLVEASSLLNVQQSTEFEYVVQKWLGTVTGLGLSDDAANSIATAIGQLGSGNIDLFNDNIGKLIAISTSNSGKDIGSILQGGLTASSVNDIMYSLFSYMANLSTNSSNVVKSEFAKVFGIKVSDLVSASNLTKSGELSSVYKNLMSYGQMYGELSYQMGELTSRIGQSKMLENLFSNFQYSTGTNIANDPLLYATWKITDMVQGVTGGINIPYITALGTGVDLETTVENLMKLAIVGVSTLGSIGDIASGLNSVGNGSSLLSAIGITSGASSVKSRGTGLGSRESGTSTSVTTMVGNSAGEDYYESTINTANDKAQQDLKQKQEETTDYTAKLYDVEIKSQEIHQKTQDELVKLAKQVSDGLQVTVANYGLITGVN